MDKTLTIGRTYAVTTATECTVTDADGKLLCTAYAGHQNFFIATTTVITFSDDSATVTAVFNLALAGGSVRGGGITPEDIEAAQKAAYDAATAAAQANSAAATAETAAEQLGDAALKSANNAYTGTNTFNGAAVFNGAVSVGEPTTDTAPLRRGERDLLSFLSEINKGELTPKLTLSSETGSITEAKNGIVCPNNGTIVSAYQKTNLTGIFGGGAYKAWNSIYIPFSLARPSGTAPWGSALAVRLCMGDSISALAANALSSLERPGWNFTEADGLTHYKHWHYAEIFLTINAADNGGSIIFRSPMYSSSSTRSVTGVTEWRSTMPSATYPFTPNSNNARGGKGFLIVRTSEYKASVYYVAEAATVQYRKIGEMYCGAGSIYNSIAMGSFCVYASGMVPTTADASATLTIPKITVQLGAPIPAADNLLAATTFTHTVENLTTAELEEKYPTES